VGAASLDLKAIIAGMVGLGLLLHGSPRSYLMAVEEGAGACGGIILQFPLYAGIMAMMEGSGLVRQFANGLTALGPPSTVPLSSFLAACVINMFIPSGGGHWAVQGPVALEAGIQAGIAPGKMILSVAYGGEVTDMLQPFWALPLLAIVGVRARDIVGYTAIVMVFAGAWMLLGLVLF
jgi:short-chain fatty acids transporter